MEVNSAPVDHEIRAMALGEVDTVYKGRLRT
jgi:hypothetical protein